MNDDHKARKREQNQKHYAKYREKIIARNLARYAMNRDQWREYQSKYRAANSNKISETARQYRLKNIEADREKSRRWNNENKERRLAIGARYRAAKVLAVMEWSEHEKIAEFYANCPAGYHVDHYYPLQGKFVCGLHVLGNLQYLPANDNARKRNNMP